MEWSRIDAELYNDPEQKVWTPIYKRYGYRVLQQCAATHGFLWGLLTDLFQPKTFDPSDLNFRIEVPVQALLERVHCKWPSLEKCLGILCEHLGIEVEVCGAGSGSGGAGSKSGESGGTGGHACPTPQTLLVRYDKFLKMQKAAWRSNPAAIRPDQSGGSGGRPTDIEQHYVATEKERSSLSTVVVGPVDKWITRETWRCRYEPEHLELARWMITMIRWANPLARKIDQAKPERWANDLRLMNVIDLIPLPTIRRVTRWALLDDAGWQKKIESAYGLRRLWPDVLAGYNKGKKQGVREEE